MSWSSHSVDFTIRPDGQKIFSKPTHVKIDCGATVPVSRLFPSIQEAENMGATFSFTAVWEHE